MGFASLSIADSYNSGFGEYDVIAEFYTPILNESIKYDRVAGYFSSQVFASAARGIAGLVRNGGKMRLLTSHAFTPQDTVSIQEYYQSEGFAEGLVNEFVNSYKYLGDLASTIAQRHVGAMCWMLREGYLEIKVVVPNSVNLTSYGVDDWEKFHPKFGVFYDNDGNQIAFSGSVNETAGAWKRNIENFDVYQSWIDNEGERRIAPKIFQFERMWNGNLGNNWRIIDLPAAVRDKIVQEFAPADFPQELESEFPTNKITLRNYQVEALTAWEMAGRVGILEMATGTGKTRTAKACISSTQEIGSLLTIVIAPYQHICDQWIRELSTYDPLPIGQNWRKKLAAAHAEFLLGRRQHLTLVVVKNTAGSRDFVKEIEEISNSFENTLLVGDEVHWLGASAFRASLIQNANYRLGLSATPSRYFDESGTNHLMDYFSGTVFKLSISDALNIVDEKGQSILCPYEYRPILVDLTEEELTRYRDLSKRIAQLRNLEDSVENQKKLEDLYFLRSAISKSAASKIPAVRKLLIDLPKPIKQCLIYCADSAQLHEVAVILHELRIDSQQITGEESTISSAKWNGMNEREFIIHNFTQGKLGVLLAIRCLDEGVDIPSAKIGIFLASSGNVKEFIQRRGRLMRPSQGKDLAVIYDFCVLPKSSNDPLTDTGLVQVEMKRITEFAEDANNREEVYNLIN